MLQYVTINVGHRVSENDGVTLVTAFNNAPRCRRYWTMLM